MRYFFDAMHITVLPDVGEALLAVRVADERVDEYAFSVEVFREVVVAYREYPPEWQGPEDLQVRVDTQNRLASLRVRVTDRKREVHRVGQSQFEAMVAQFEAQDRVRG